MEYRGKKIRIAGHSLICLMIAVMFALSGCGNGKKAEETQKAQEQEEASASFAPETKEKASKNNEPSKEESQTDEAKHPDPIEEEPEASGPIQGKYPAQISIVGSDESEDMFFFDTDGDIIKVEKKSADGTVTKEEIEYVLDEQGNKVCGFTEDALVDTCIPLRYSASDHKLTTKPLIQKTESTQSGSDSVHRITFSYDADNRVTGRTEGGYEGERASWERQTDYTYEEQEGNLTVTSFGEEGQYTYQYNKDNYLMLQSIKSGESNDSFFSTTAYEYDEKNRLTAVLEKSSREEAGSDTNITWDGKGNLQCLTSSLGYVTEYEGYDENGNWMACTYYVENDEMDCFLICEYDESGNRITRSFGIGDEMKTAYYHYDEEGRLIDICVDDELLYQLTYNSDGLLERLEKVYEYQFGETEKKAVHWYVLDQELWNEVEAYVGDYTGIPSSSNRVSSRISYRNGAVFGY